MASLTLVRGQPGSGKTSLAKKLVGESLIFHFEADQYFNFGGVYKFDITKLSSAHSWCQRQTEYCLSLDEDVVVSNTFTTISELRPYFNLARKYHIIPNVIVCQGEFGSIHNVPEETLARMKARFAYDISSLYKELYATQNSNS